VAQPAPECRLLQDIPAAQAARQPDAPALWWQREAISYRALADNVRRAAARLAAIGTAGERIAVLAWNCPELVELIYAAPAAGRVLVPLNARLAPAELAWQLAHSGAACLLGDAALLAPLVAHADCPRGIEVVAFGDRYRDWLAGAGAALPASQPGDAVWLLFTSGSTGRPKAAVLTHASFLAGLRSAALARPVAAGDRFFYPFPLFHVAAHNVLLQHLYGAGVVLARSFDAGETLAACRDLGVTTMSLAPTMLAMLLDHPEFRAADLAAVRTIGYGAAAMPAGLLRRLLAQTGVGLCQSYGMTELSGSVAFLTAADHRLAASTRPQLLASVGRPLPTAEVKVVDDAGRPLPPGAAGEVLVRAPQCMAGYWRDPEASAAALRDGWLHTGDIGRFDEGGYLYLVDRRKDMIISGGENVASREVEEVLRRHAAVRDCAVIGLPDERWGECVSAVLVTSEPVADAALAAHCRALLAGYKTPRRWFRVDALPVNAAGKVDKPALRAHFA